MSKEHHNRLTQKKRGYSHAAADMTHGIHLGKLCK